MRQLMAHGSADEFFRKICADIGTGTIEVGDSERLFRIISKQVLITPVGSGNRPGQMIDAKFHFPSVSEVEYIGRKC